MPAYMMNRLYALYFIVFLVIGKYVDKYPQRANHQVPLFAAEVCIGSDSKSNEFRKKNKGKNFEMLWKIPKIAAQDLNPNPRA